MKRKVVRVSFKVKEKKFTFITVCAFAVAMLMGTFVGAAPVSAAGEVQITGKLGAPSATTTIKGDQLPPMPDKKFGGKIERNVTQSTPYWPPRLAPPKGAPNILLIITDDAGYGVSSTFGGVIPTPAMDRVAKEGLRYTNFHSTSVCSPTRASHITGRNHHQVGTGSIPELSTGYPGYNSIMTKDKATIARILKGHSYVTSWFGKNHNTPDLQNSKIGPLISGRSVWALTISMGSWAVTPASGNRPIWPATRPISTHSMTIPILT